MNLENLKIDIREAAKKAFSLIRSNSEEKFIAYALYSDAGAMTVGASANTYANLNEMSSEDPDDSVYYKWSPGEWDYDAQGAEFFSDISQKLSQYANEIDDSQFTEFRVRVYEICVQALEDLVADSFFDEESIIVFTISDDEIPENEVAWIKRLNTSEDSLEFENWVNSL